MKEKSGKCGFKEYSAFIMEHIPYLENVVSVAICIINGNIDFSEDNVNKAMNWVKGVSPKFGDHLEEHYLRVIMEGSVDPKIQSKAFPDQFRRKFFRARQLLKRSLVDRLVRSLLKSCLKSDLVDKMLFVRCIQVYHFCILSVRMMILNSGFV